MCVGKLQSVRERGGIVFTSRFSRTKVERHKQTDKKKVK